MANGLFRRSISSLILVGVVAASSVAQASVSLKNGNFFMAYTDIVYPGGFEPKIERVYNSKTAFQGMFGWGWGTEYEAYLRKAPDGSVVVHEYGGGAENRFIPVKYSSQDVDKAVEAIVGAARKANAVGGGDQIAAYKQKLKSDVTFRNEEWDRFAKQLPSVQIPNGTQLQSNRFSYQYITKVQDGYIRTFDSGKTEKFNEAGKLVRISDKNNNFIDLAYGKDGHLQKLSDNFNRKIFFTFNNQGLLESLQGENSKKAEYKYNNRRELVQSKDVDGHVYTYKYDSSRHNMVEIGYSDKTTLQIAYFGMDLNENVKSVKDRDGTITEYGYKYDKANKTHYSVTVKTKGSDGQPISSSEYEYFVAFKNDGEEWTQRMITTIDGDRTETVYNQQFGLPISIKHNGEETTFAYDNKGHVTKKTTPTEVTELTYDPKVSKISKVVRQSKLNPKQSTWSSFQYDDKGNLTVAKNSEGKGVRLFYDGNGRIRSLVDQNKRQINFKYNENSKPIEISDPSLGTITVTYSNSGEIKKVESSAGRKIAMQVSTGFQNLLDIIRPAGVNLSF